MMRPTRLLPLTFSVLTCLTMTLSASEPASDSPLEGKKMELLNGTEVALDDYLGDVVLVVNVASRCGATPQYADLQKLHEKYAEKGLTILGFPCNQFGGQEPGTAEQIAAFCEKNYGVGFTMFDKVDVNGPNACSLYQELTSKKENPKFAGPIRWNFEKFLIARDGSVIARFRTGENPSSAKVTKAIEAELAKKAPAEKS